MGFNDDLRKRLWGVACLLADVNYYREGRLRIAERTHQGRGRPLSPAQQGTCLTKGTNIRLIQEADSLFPERSDRFQQLARFMRKTRGTSIVANDVISDA
jgi:hypothetical protein